MAGADKTVFLSYRREVSGGLAHAVRAHLTVHGFDVFMDVGSIGGGEFAPVILRQIEEREHFVVLLERESFRRISDDGDWLRREIAHALAHDRSVVPLLANGAVMPEAAALPDDVARLTAFNAVSLPHDYFDAAMQKLRESFLAPVRPQAHAAPRVTAQASAPSSLASRVSGDEVELFWAGADSPLGFEVEQSRSVHFDRSRLLDRQLGTRWTLPRADLVHGSWFRARPAVRGEPGGPWLAETVVSAFAPEAPRLSAERGSVWNEFGHVAMTTMTWTAVPGAVEYLVEEVDEDGTPRREVYRGAPRGARDEFGSDSSRYRVQGVSADGTPGAWSATVQAVRRA